MASNALASLVSDNPRYKDLFDLNTQTANSGVDMAKDYTGDMNRLRDEAAVQPGSLRDLLGVPDMPFSEIKRDSYTFLSYRACEIGFRENQVFSSEGYNESAGIRLVARPFCPWSASRTSASAPPRNRCSSVRRS